MLVFSIFKSPELYAMVRSCAEGAYEALMGTTKGLAITCRGRCTNGRMGKIVKRSGDLKKGPKEKL